MTFNISIKDFGRVDDKDIKCYTVTNPKGVSFSVSNYGAILVSYKPLDVNNASKEVVIGFNNVDDYINDSFYVGATIGRYAGRINQARVKIAGVEYLLTQNENENILHGGVNALNSKIWQVKFIENQTISGIELSCTSHHLDNGFPGNVNFVARYTIDLAGDLSIEYFAVTDQDTVINMTNHSYYNLNLPDGDILGQNISINASKYVEVDDCLIPSGRLLECADTVYNLSSIGKSVKDDFGYTIKKLKQIGINNLDMSYVLPESKDVVLALDMSCRETLLGLKFYTNQKIVHVFTSNDLCKPYAGIAVECQNFSDAPNHSNFKSSILTCGEIYYNYMKIEPYHLKI